MACGVNALAVLGEAERAKEWMAREPRIDPEDLLMRYNFACGLMAYLNDADADAALAMLAPVLAQDVGGYVNDARTDPDSDAVRDDPRFQAMLAVAEARLAAG
jgi:adenylate cyclase